MYQSEAAFDGSDRCHRKPLEEEESQEDKGRRRGGRGRQKAISTRTSRTVPHFSTNHALNRLTSEFEWVPVHST